MTGAGAFSRTGAVDPLFTMASERASRALGLAA